MNIFFNLIFSKLKYSYIIGICLLLFSTKNYAQELFLLRYNGPSICFTDCIVVDSYFYLSNNIVIEPIAEYNNFFVFDKFPTYLELLTSKEQGFNCDWRSPPICWDRISLKPTDCSWVISNKVLAEPTAITNSFCDKITLTATGCTGSQRFYWEYSKDGINYTPTNTYTSFNQNYEFVKANFPALNNYSGNIFFRVLIDWDLNTTVENMYSNAVNYNITSCSPLLNGSPITSKVKCYNQSSGSVILKFLTDITSTQKLLLTLYENSQFISHKFVKDTEIVNKMYTWEGLPKGSYIIKYQAQNKSDDNTTLGSFPIETPTFNIENVQPLTFYLTAIQPSCNTDKGKVQISANGGTGTYFYILDNETLANKHPFTSPYIVPNELSEGDHKITVIDSNECTEKQS